MYDRILEGYLTDFVESNSLGSLGQADAFEYFASYCILARELSDTFELESVIVGGPGDMGIDGLAILVNDHVVISTEDIDFFKSRLRRLDVRFLFIQAKTGSTFDMGEMGNFLFGVRSFFSRAMPPNANSRIRELWLLKERIYDYSIHMDSSPTCEMYFLTSGRWTEDPALINRIAAEKDQLRQTNLFTEVLFSSLDADAIKSIYRQLKRKVVKEIIFDKHTILPPIDNIQEAYIGVIPAAEYLKLISDEEGKLERTLFYDNVRDFQGNNPVNQDIAATLTNAQKRDKFVVLNNGITVVAQSLTKIGSAFKLKDYQIVNGCQTSHVLFSNHKLLKNVLVPIKLIVTSDQDVTALIIKGTNRQTEVKVEAFESLRSFQKELEEFYNTFGKDRLPRLYYERRSKQYDYLPIQKSQIISLTAQLKAFLAMFLNEPHSTHRYYGELLEANRARVFISGHSPYPYYISALALHRAEGMFATGELGKEWKTYKYQLLMLFRMVAEVEPPPYLNNRKAMDRYCGHLLAVLSDKQKYQPAFYRSLEIIKGRLGQFATHDVPAARLRAFTAEISVADRGRPATVAGVERLQGIVKIFSDVKGYGFITPDGGGGDVFVHYSGIRGPGYRTLDEGQRVEFVRVDAARGPQVADLVVIAPASSAAR